MKKTSRYITHAESNTRRRLRLSKEAIRRLQADDLSRVNGACDTTSWTTDNPRTQGTQGTVSNRCQ